MLRAFFLGWVVGFEPTTSRSTIWRSNQLNYAHRVDDFGLSKSGAKVQTFCHTAKYFFIQQYKRLNINIIQNTKTP